MYRSTFDPMILLVLMALVMMGLLAVGGATMPGPAPEVQTTPWPTLTPTVTPAPGWWDEVDFATPALKALPDVPDPVLGGVGSARGEPVPFSVLSCPTTGVKITGIRTAAGPWWHIFGTASIPHLWYWKAEVSADGVHWAMLYRSEAPVRDDLLVRLNLTTVPAGALQIRLVAVDRTGNYPLPCVVRVRE